MIVLIFANIVFKHQPNGIIAFCCRCNTVRLCILFSSRI